MAPSQTQDVDKLTLTVFREVWNEFYAWKHSACEAAIQKLAATDEAIRLVKDDYAGLFDSASARTSETPSDFVVYDFCSKSTSNTSTISINASSITPASQYESCAPIPRNVLHGDDPNEMAFVPYADDTNFNEVDYAMEYKNLSWQVDNDPDTEYKGELIFPPTLNTRDKVAKHRGRSYVYALNAEYDNDGSYAGNESRFFNHAKGQKTNCAVTIKVVNGEHRIGVYAKRNIPAGTELFLDYGPEFTFN
ncbi:hypothetical protein EW026_g3363 [Hermanssonia centrifuga]|uniref:SET domain-containing protein n=1 Tax=Hermanssonia centrifuga TaxID=98765 RepID=A0A4S4KKB8_9APHY|nr:hypothetical protein EW026_g3363 [Hermanssonia centrifuga]